MNREKNLKIKGELVDFLEQKVGDPNHVMLLLVETISCTIAASEHASGKYTILNNIIKCISEMRDQAHAAIKKKPQQKSGL